MNITILDGKYANPGDLSWDSLKEFGSLSIYQETNPDELVNRSKDSDIIVINKMKVTSEVMDNLPNLKLIVISATGTDNVDLNAAKARDIVVNNVVGYSTDSVAQHVFSMMLHLTNQPGTHDESVKKGEWGSDKGFSYTLLPVTELKGKVLGIYGFGKIGQRVAEIGRAFGMKIYVTSEHASEEDYPYYRMVELPALFESSDVVSLHAPLTEANEEIIGSQLIGKMKSSAILINTARGGLVNEADLYQALGDKSIRAAALDVLSSEPPATSHPLLQLNNCLVTPHMAWTSITARKELIRGVTENVARYMKHKNGQET